MASIDQAALRELRRRFQGQVIAPDDPRYDQARRVVTRFDLRLHPVGPTVFSADLSRSSPPPGRRGRRGPRAATGRRPSSRSSPTPSSSGGRVGLGRRSWEALARFSDAGVYVNNLGEEDRVRGLR